MILLDGKLRLLVRTAEPGLGKTSLLNTENMNRRAHVTKMPRPSQNHNFVVKTHMGCVLGGWVAWGTHNSEVSVRSMARLGGLSNCTSQTVLDIIDHASYRPEHAETDRVGSQQLLFGTKPYTDWKIVR
jgi:hypothetical protein